MGIPETITLGSISHLSSHRRKSRTFRNLDGKTMSGGDGKLSRGSNRGALDVFQVWSSIVNIRGHAGTKRAQVRRTQADYLKWKVGSSARRGRRGPFLVPFWSEWAGIHQRSWFGDPLTPSIATRRRCEQRCEQWFLARTWIQYGKRRHRKWMGLSGVHVPARGS